MAVGAVHVDAAFEGGADALACQFDHAKLGHGEDFGAGAVLGHFVGEEAFDFALVAFFTHIDEVDHNHAAQIAQTQLPHHFLERFLVHVERSEFGVAHFAVSAGVDVDGDEGFGGVDDEGAAVGEFDAAGVDFFDFAFDAEFLVEGHGAGVKLDNASGAGIDDGEEVADAGGDLFVIHNYSVDVFVEDVADGTNDKIGFLIEFNRRLVSADAVGDDLPHADEVVEIALKFFFGDVGAGGADDEAEVFWGGEFLQGAFEFAALFEVFDFA